MKAALHQRLDLVLPGHCDGMLRGLVAVFREFHFERRDIELSVFRGGANLGFRFHQYRDDQAGLGCLDGSQQGSRLDGGPIAVRIGYRPFVC